LSNIGNSEFLIRGLLTEFTYALILAVGAPGNRVEFDRFLYKSCNKFASFEWVDCGQVL
ncbi:hypothetical protein T4B_5399, partial [Trichinella pseudospiralis]